MIQKRRVIFRGVAIFIILGILVLFYPVMSYWLADYQYERLINSGASTKTDVESVLFLYTIKQIDPKESFWGNAYTLHPGERCYQYRILGREPIDIVFNGQGRVKRIFASFE